MIETLKENNRAFKLIASGAFLLMAVAVLVARSSPVKGYELSIYLDTPAVVWAFVLIAMAVGIFILVYLAMTRSESRIWMVALLIILMGHAIVTLIPTLRGYYFLNPGDSAGHVGITKDIIQFGTWFPGNTYPVLHIFAWGLSSVSGVPPEILLRYVTPLFSVLFILSLFLLSRTILTRWSAVLLAVAMSSAPLLGYYHAEVYPAGAALLFMPLVFYLYFRGRAQGSPEFIFLFIMAIILFTYMHPAAEVLLITYLIVGEFVWALWNMRTGVRLNEGLTVNLPAISAAAFFSWISTQVFFESQVVSFFELLTLQTRELQHVNRLQGVLAGQNITLWDLFIVNLKLYGDILVVSVLGLAGALLLVRAFLRRQEESRYLYIMAGIFLVSGPIWTIVFAGGQLTTPGRWLGANPLVWGGIPLSGFVLYEVFSRVRSRRWALVAITPIILFVVVLSVIFMYPSPGTLQPSPQVNRNEVTGIEWYYDHDDPRVDVLPMGFADSTGAFAIGYHNNQSLPNLRRWYYQYVTQVYLSVDMLNYDRWDTWRGWLWSPIYVQFAERFRIDSTSPAFSGGILGGGNLASQGFDVNDFLAMDSDPAFSKVFSNGKFEILLARP